eukprot:COSAG01_NODE_7408_length_3210_cov_40.721706_1_plen_76_part_00
MNACHGVYLERSNAVAIVFPVHRYLQLHTYTFILYYIIYISCTGVKIPAFRYLPKTHDIGPDSGRSAPSHMNVII